MNNHFAVDFFYPLLFDATAAIVFIIFLGKIFLGGKSLLNNDYCMEYTLHRVAHGIVMTCHYLFIQ